MEMENSTQGKERAGQVDHLRNSDFLYRISSFHYGELLRNVMVKDPYTARPGDLVQTIASEMASRKISSAIITDENLRPMGIVTERDIVRKVVAKGREDLSVKKISDIMTPNPVYLSPDDSLFDALAILSRFAVKHLPIVQLNRVVGIITLRQLMKIRHYEPLVIIGKLNEAHSTKDLLKIREDLILLTEEKLSTNSDPVDIVTMLSLINEEIHKRLLIRTIKEHSGTPPVDFCFFVTGSHGRRENLLFPDQDFCVIIEDYDDRFYNDYDLYFREISAAFSDYLNEAGFPYCSGNVMGSNPTWRKRISEWILHLKYIFSQQGPYTIRYMTLIFDSAPLYGNTLLFEEYSLFAHKLISENHNILWEMHLDEESGHKVPLGWFSTFITEKDEDHKGEIDMKRSGLIFIIEMARILALKHGIRDTSTLRRLRALVAKGVINKDDSEYFENAYRVILYYTLRAQTENHLKRSVNNYYLNPKDLSPRNRERLKQAFKAIANLQDIVRSDFGELVL